LCYVISVPVLTLAQARARYYNGQKRTKEIESKFIYNANDAQRLAEWVVNDQAEGFLYIDLLLPYHNYVDKNSKATQYQIGDIIYLDGIYQDIEFNSQKLFVIREIIKTDQGRAIQLKAKSVKPISEL